MEKERITVPRFRGSKVDKIKKIDMFTKLREPYKETSSVGGTCGYYLVDQMIEINCVFQFQLSVFS